MAFQRMFIRIANPQFDRDWITSHAYSAPTPRPEKELARIQKANTTGSTYSLATVEEYTAYRKARAEQTK